MTNSEKLNFILTNGIANRVADFIPRICEDSDILINIAENVHNKSLYDKEIESMDMQTIEIFDRCIEYDYERHLKYKDDVYE